MALQRYPEWDALLQELLFARCGERFRYGVFDCCLFAADAVKAMTGSDLAARFRGRYGSRKEAVAIIRAYAGRPTVQALVEQLARDYQLPEIGLLRAQRGDLVMLPRGRNASLGLVDLNGFEAVVPSPRGLWRLPLARAARAWRV